MESTATRLRMALLLAILFSLPACSSYQLRGVVVEGPRPGVYVVDANDARLRQTAVPDARVLAILDPDKIRSKALPPTQSDDHGRFAIAIDDPGAGLLDYSVGLECAAPGYGDAGVDKIALPGANQRLLVVLSAGRSKRPPKATDPKDDILNEVDKFKKQFE